MNITSIAHFPIENPTLEDLECVVWMGKELVGQDVALFIFDDRFSIAFYPDATFSFSELVKHEWKPTPLFEIIEGDVLGNYSAGEMAERIERKLFRSRLSTL